MKIIRAGYTIFFNMFKTIVLTCRSYTHEKNTVRIDCHCHCHCQNDYEWSPRMNMNHVNSCSFSNRFGSETWSLSEPYTQHLLQIRNHVLNSTPSCLLRLFHIIILTGAMCTLFCWMLLKLWIRWTIANSSENY